MYLNINHIYNKKTTNLKYDINESWFIFVVSEVRTPNLIYIMHCSCQLS